MRYAVDIVGGKVWVAARCKCIPYPDLVDVRVYVGKKGSHFYYMHFHDSRWTAKASMVRIMSSSRYKDGSPWEIFGDDK